MRIKTLAPLRWRPAGGHTNLRLVVIAPLGYRPRKGSRLLYRRPAYLIATDTALSPQPIVQHDVWRWDSEVDFRDQKTLPGLGQARLRHPRSVEAAPRLLVAAYAGLLPAARQAYGPAGFPDAPPPKWRAKRSKPRPSTQDLMPQPRAEPGRGLATLPRLPLHHPATPEAAETPLLAFLPPSSTPPANPFPPLPRHPQAASKSQPRGAGVSPRARARAERICAVLASRGPRPDGHGSVRLLPRARAGMGGNLSTASSFAIFVRRSKWFLMGYPLHSGDPNILWLGSRGLGVPVGDDRSIRRWVHGHCLLHKAVEEFSPAA